MEMTKPIPLLHAAIWEGDVSRIHALLQEASICTNQLEDTALQLSENHKNPLLAAKDALGNTALHLATRLVQPAQRTIVKMLLEHGASVSSRSADGWSCVHDATLCDDEFLLAHLFLQGERQLWREVNEYQSDFLDALERLPDFEVEIFVEAYSWIPGVSKMLPSQTHRLLKRGSQLRVDSSMKGLERFNLNHGNISHVFTGRGSEGPTAYIVNHDTKKFYDISSAVNETSSLAKIDLGLHMLLTKELSTTSIDSSKLEFVKLKDVQEIKTKQKNGTSTRHACPWTGTKYEMKNLAATFAFRNPVNPRREHRQFAGDGIGAAEAALGVVQGYVNEISASSSIETTTTTANKKRNSNPRSMMDTSLVSDNDGRETPDKKAAGAGASGGEGSNQELWLPKSQNMEMHLDVRAGDQVAWRFSCNSSHYSFVATSYCDDVAQPVARCASAKNAAIDGAFVVESDGNFVLKWLNTQKGFTLDKKGIKIVYQVTHTRPSIAGLADQMASDQRTDTETTLESSLPATATDVDVCRRFQRLDHIPNPMTVVMSFQDYFLAGASSSSAPRNHKNQEDSKKLPSLFKRATKSSSKPKSPALSTTSDASPSKTTIALDGTEYRNTFRSLTLQPTPRRFHKNFEGKVFMAQDFPIQMRDFVPVIEFLSKTSDQVKNLSEFFSMKLPPGFPVRFELPMMFTVRAAYTFQKAVIRDDIDPELFLLPRGYTQVTAVKDILPQQG